MQGSPGVVEAIFGRKQQPVDIGVDVDPEGIEADIATAVFLTVVEFGIRGVETQRAADLDRLVLFFLVDVAGDITNVLLGPRLAGARFELNTCDLTDIAAVVRIGDGRVFGVGRYFIVAG